MLSIRKWANFLPVGKDFTIPARNFLPVGKGLQGSPAKATKRHDGRGRSDTEAVKESGNEQKHLAPRRKGAEMKTENKGVVNCKSLRLSVSARGRLFFHTSLAWAELGRPFGAGKYERLLSNSLRQIRN